LLKKYILTQIQSINSYNIQRAPINREIKG
jgi:hypothetical protein